MAKYPQVFEYGTRPRTKLEKLFEKWEHENRWAGQENSAFILYANKLMAAGYTEISNQIAKELYEAK